MSVLPGDPVDALEPDPFGADAALRAPEALAQFNRAGVLAAADVHVARTLCGLAEVPFDGPAGGSVLLATALAIRATRLGHVLVDLETISRTAAVEHEELPVAELPWPEASGWVRSVSAAGRLVATGAIDGPEPKPLRLLGSRLYLDRYWREERQLADALAGFAAMPLAPVELAQLADALAWTFPDDGDLLQRIAAASGVLSGLTVIAGGPGTGKTTTVARIAAVLAELAAARGVEPPLIALCAPTGKAAARLQEAIHDEAADLQLAETIRDQLLSLPASTIHRLLSWSHGRARHNAGNRLPHDVVVVDETSMVPLSLMARLLEAVRTDARVVLVGDPDQLSSIETGAVLRDIVGPAADQPHVGAGMRSVFARVAGGEPTGGSPASAPSLAMPPADSPISQRSFGDGVIVLSRGHRFGVAIGSLADAIRRGDSAGALAALAGAASEVTWLQVDAADDRGLAPVRDRAVAAFGAVLSAARAGDGAAALAALGGFRLLCSHRRGAYGVSSWTARVERWLADAIDGFEPGDRGYAGRPLLITENDRELNLFNGDTGVVINTDDGEQIAAFEREGELVGFAPSRLAAVETLYATTVHKAQGSQFAVAAVVLPDPGSRVLTRELLYTAVTRARDQLILVGGEAAIRAAIERPVARASGLRELLWGEGEPTGQAS